MPIQPLPIRSTSTWAFFLTNDGGKTFHDTTFGGAAVGGGYDYTSALPLLVEPVALSCGGEDSIQ